MYIWTMILRHPEDSHVKRIDGMGTLFEVHFSLRSLTAPSWTLQPRQEIMISQFHNLAYQKKKQKEPSSPCGPGIVLYTMDLYSSIYDNAKTNPLKYLGHFASSPSKYIQPEGHQHRDFLNFKLLGFQNCRAPIALCNCIGSEDDCTWIHCW